MLIDDSYGIITPSVKPLVAATPWRSTGGEDDNESYGVGVILATLPCDTVSLIPFESFNNNAVTRHPRVTLLSSRHPSSYLYVMHIGLFYGSSTCYTQMVAEKIQALLGADLVTLHNLKETPVQTMAQYDALIFGISTWDFGEIQEDWQANWDAIDQGQAGRQTDSPVWAG